MEKRKITDDFAITLKTDFGFLLTDYSFRLGDFTSENLNLVQCFFNDEMEIFVSCSITDEPRVQIKKQNEYKIDVTNSLIVNKISIREFRLKDLKLDTINRHFEGKSYNIKLFMDDYISIGYVEFNELFYELSEQLKINLSSKKITSKRAV